jgi:photosystem II stability/assembly factor-like uncharacterized protein
MTVQASLSKLVAAKDVAATEVASQVKVANARLLLKKTLTLTQTRSLVASLGKVSSALGEIGNQSAAIAAEINTVPAPPSATGWRTLKLGGGGFITGISISNDGKTRVIHNDTYGDHRWINDAWEPMHTLQAMGPQVATPGGGGHVYETVVAPSDASRVYKWFRGKVYRSDDGGKTFKVTAYAPVPDMLEQGGYNWRTSGPNMAVDPANPNIVFAGGYSAPVRVTKDGGATWADVSGLPAPTPAGARIAFATSAFVFIHIGGKGVYRSTDSGSTWQSIGGPADVFRLVAAKDGSLYAVDSSQAGQKYIGGAWSPMGTGQWFAIALDPHNTNRIVLCGGGYLATSIDRGVTWVQTPGQYWEPHCVVPNTPWPSQKRKATGDVPWLEWTQECIISIADVRFDPVVPNRLWAATGVGVMYYDFASATAAPDTQITWQTQTRGIEQLCTNAIVSPPGGKPNWFGWDRPQFLIEDPEVYPSKHGPTAMYAISMGWGADYCAAQPTFLAAVMNYWPDGNKDGKQSGFSTDGGRTWTKFATEPPDMAIGGNIAVCSPNMMLWSPQNNQHPAITRDGGKTWQKLFLPGIPTTGESGYGFAYYLNTEFAAADRVAPNTAYQYNYLGAGGIFRIDDKGVVRIKVGGAIMPGASSANAKLKTVLGHAGHMFFTHGPQGDGNTDFGGFFRATNGHTAGEGQLNLVAVPKVGGCKAFGFGKSSTDYPTVFISGWVDGVYGIWRGDGTLAEWDSGTARWTNLGAFPMGVFDSVDAVEGDANEVGKVYVGFAGSGAAYYA